MNRSAPSSAPEYEYRFAEYEYEKVAERTSAITGPRMGSCRNVSTAARLRDRVGIERDEATQESDAMAAQGTLNESASQPVGSLSNRRRWGDWASWLLCIVLLLAGLTGWSPWRGNRTANANRPMAQSGHVVAPEKQLRTKSIEAIQAGDRVLARDPETGSTGIKRVVELYRRTSDHVRIVQIRSSEGAIQELRTTDEHPFWVPDAGWIDAGQLQAGQSLRQQDGSLAHVVSTRRESHPEGVPVYNFQTEGYHTYFASQASGAPAILVHNKCGENSGASSTLSSALRAKLRKIEAFTRQAGNTQVSGRVTPTEARQLAEKFVGEGFTVGTTSKGTWELKSADGLRMVRGPSAKPTDAGRNIHPISKQPFSMTGAQVNFQSRPSNSGTYTSNVHLDVGE